MPTTQMNNKLLKKKAEEELMLEEKAKRELEELRKKREAVELNLLEQKRAKRVVKELSKKERMFRLFRLVGFGDEDGRDRESKTGAWSLRAQDGSRRHLSCRLQN